MGKLNQQPVKEEGVLCLAQPSDTAENSTNVSLPGSARKDQRTRATQGWTQHSHGDRDTSYIHLSHKEKGTYTFKH